jgi:hypothetical protein
MSILDVLYPQVKGRVQFGPVYRCWICDQPAVRLVPWHEWVPPPSSLDRYATHLAYLDLPGCNGHPCRVALVGPAITPVDWPRNAPAAQAVTSIEEAIDLLATALQEKQEQEGLPGPLDQALKLALRLRAGAVTPTQGAAEIRTLVAP